MHIITKLLSQLSLVTTKMSAKNIHCSLERIGYYICTSSL